MLMEWPFQLLGFWGSMMGVRRMNSWWRYFSRKPTASPFDTMNGHVYAKNKIFNNNINHQTKEFF